MKVENEILDIVADAEATYQYKFEPEILELILNTTRRKCQINGKGNDYLPILLMNELRDYVARIQINKMGEVMLCARNAVQTLA